MGVVTKRSSMTFFSNPRDHYCHRVRIVLAEKGIAVDIVDVDQNHQPEDLPLLNPYNEVPTLVDRDLTLFESSVIMEYLDERFPHPPLLPVYPVARAQSRLLMHRIQRDWCAYIDKLLSGGSDQEMTKARKELRDQLIAIAPVFGEKPFFMNEEFTLVDCTIAPILWRLGEMGIDLPAKQCEAMIDYGKRIFDKDSFQASLSEQEREMQYAL